MAKLGPKEIRARALREAQQSSRGGGESRPAKSTVGRDIRQAGSLIPAREGQVLREPGAAGHKSPVEAVCTSQVGVASGPREAIPSSDAARAAPRKPKHQPPGASPAASGTTTHQYRDPEKRKAYMREYMKSRRAKLRAKREQAR